MVGFLLQWPTLTTLVVFPFLVMIYRRLSIAEEREVRARFGPAWDAYAAVTLRHRPAPLPNTPASQCANTQPGPGHRALESRNMTPATDDHDPSSISSWATNPTTTKQDGTDDAQATHPQRNLQGHLRTAP